MRKIGALFASFTPVLKLSGIEMGVCNEVRILARLENPPNERLPIIEGWMIKRIAGPFKSAVSSYLPA